MNETTVFGAGVLLTGAFSLAVVLTLDRPLRSLLVELCGTRERAGFWSALSRVVFVAVPLIFALHAQPEPAAGVPVLLALATQLEWSLIGIVLAAVALGMVLAAFLPATPAARTSPESADTERGPRRAS